MGARSFFYSYYFKLIRQFGYAKTIDTYIKDIPEYIEQLKYVQWRLDTETPNSNVYHDWQVVKNALSPLIEKVKKSTDKLIEEWNAADPKVKEDDDSKEIQDFYIKILDIEYDWIDAFAQMNKANNIFGRQSYWNWKAKGGKLE